MALAVFLEGESKRGIRGGTNMRIAMSEPPKIS